MGEPWGSRTIPWRCPPQGCNTNVSPRSAGRKTSGDLLGATEPGDGKGQVISGQVAAKAPGAILIVRRLPEERRRPAESVVA